MKSQKCKPETNFLSCETEKVQPAELNCRFHATNDDEKWKMESNFPVTQTENSTEYNK